MILLSRLLLIVGHDRFWKKRYDQVMSMIKSSELCGQAMIAYLQQKGFPEVALHFVKDVRTRFNLALGSGNIQIAVASAKEILQAAEKNMTDATQLNYDFRNPFVVCGATYVPIYRGQKDVSCPYCSSRFVPDQEGKLCTVCDLSVVGSDASGLLCSPTQIR